MEMRIGHKIFDCRSRLHKRMAEDDGLTLVEIMVSMMIFLVVSTGIAGTMIAGLQSTVSARFSTFGKEEAQQQIEEMRSRTYYVPYSSDPNVGTTADYDLLDIYYPNLNTNQTIDNRGWTGQYYSGSDAHYTKVSPPDEHGIIRTVETRFVYSDRSVVVPPSSYNSKSAGNDIPPSDLVDVKVTTSWSDRTGPNTYTLETLISATGQTPPVVESGCIHSSNSRVDANGLMLTVSDGTDEPYSAVVNGILGDAHASAVYSCNSNILVSSTGGQMSIVGGSTFTGANISISGPPAIQRVVGPESVGPPASWPMPTITNSSARGFIGDETGSKEVDAEANASVGSQSLGLDEVNGTPTDSDSGYYKWDFLNPAITATGAMGDDEDDCDMDDEDDLCGNIVDAKITQDNGITDGTASVSYDQVNILPLGKWPTSTTANPSAIKGLVFIRNFQAGAEAKADAVPGHATATITYSFTLGMFNPNKSGCYIGDEYEEEHEGYGDSCYDLYTITPSNPLQNVSLSNSNYRLQNALISEWHSYTNDEINQATDTSADGKTATITADALVKITAAFGQEIRWKTSNPHQDEIDLINQYGIQKSWLGAFDLTVEQDG